ncbi:MAG TPA: hypothetical protein VNU95_09150 [Candidatus Acidoferrales bacterium]|jgi:hypothetical protein|nr:hypothetical protein [Candidatus Acidoferrales bacterium]
MKSVRNQTDSKKKDSFIVIAIATAMMAVPIAIAFWVVYLAKNLNIELGHRLNMSNNSIPLLMMGEFGLLALLLVKFELIMLKKTNFLESLKRRLAKK